MNIIDFVGNTPLIKLDGLTGKANIFVKLESRNYAGSVKDRIVVSMLEDAQEKGLLKDDPDFRIIEPTSGNTGIALAACAAALGYKATLLMPESMSVERRQTILSYGAELILTPAAKGTKGAVEEAERIVQANPEKCFMLQQFENPANPRTHFYNTAPEIETELEGRIDAFVAGVGTGGTFSGTTRYLKPRHSSMIACAVEPAESQAIAAHFSGDKEFKPSPHGIQGIGAGFVPKNLAVQLIDRVMKISTPEAKEMAKKVMQSQGISCGISGGANVAAALKLSEDEAFAGKNIVTVIPDAADKYFSVLCN